MHGSYGVALEVLAWKDLQASWEACVVWRLGFGV